MVEETTGQPKVRMVRVRQGQEGQRLDNFLLGQLTGAPRALIYKIIRTGQVRINGGRAKPSTRLQDGDDVRVPPIRVADRSERVIPEWALEAVSSAIIEEDSDLLVINKPAGMAVHGGSGLGWGLIDVIRDLRKGSTIELVHRIDRETSGCLLLAKTKGSMRELQRQFREGEADKRYLCLMDGRLRSVDVDIDEPLLKVERGGERFVQVDPRGKPAQTLFHLLEQLGQYSYAEARILTGRTHQIRAHAAHIGLPLAGDSRYLGSARRAYWRSKGLRRLFLHACSLSVEMPAGTPRSFNCPLPEALGAQIDGLRQDVGEP